MKIIHGECLEEMRKMESNSIDFIVTDPPYGLHFMGKKWDYDVPSVEIWKEALRVCKPGSMMAAFGGSRTYHRLASSIEDAGWEIRDCIMWITGQGFPKSHNFGCKCKGKPVQYNHVQRSTKSHCDMQDMSKRNNETSLLGKEDEGSFLQQNLQWQGKIKEFNSIQQQREGENMPREGFEVGKQSSLEGRSNIQKKQGELYRPEVCSMPTGISHDVQERRLHNGTQTCDGKKFESNSFEDGSGTSQRPQYKEQFNRESGTFFEQSRTQERRGKTCETCKGIIGFEGYGTALKPAYEPIILAMKPLQGTYLLNAELFGVAGINIDRCRVESNDFEPKDSLGAKKIMQDRFWNSIQNLGQRKIIKRGNNLGRWPANVILDEEAGKFLDQMSGESKSIHAIRRNTMKHKNSYDSTTSISKGDLLGGYNDSGGASRFFYCAKTSQKERGDENKHPTVKPISLMQYIIKLLAPPGSPTLLDPFMGSGSTLLAAQELGINAIGIEKEEEYCNISRKRLGKKTEQFELRF